MIGFVINIKGCLRFETYSINTSPIGLHLFYILTDCFIEHHKPFFFVCDFGLWVLVCCGLTSITCACDSWKSDI